MIKCENCGYFYADVDDDPNWEEMELIDDSTT